jgi:hypothetical protein
MFLRKVYRYNKWMFSGMLFFMLIQLIFFWKGFVVFSPWYNYGMYSEVLKPQKEYSVYNIPSKWPANLQLLSPQRDDKVYVTLDRYHALTQNSFMYHSQIKPKFTTLHLPQADSSSYVMNLPQQDFLQWFERYTRFWINSNIDINKKPAIWDGKILSISPSYFTDSNANIHSR